MAEACHDVLQHTSGCSALVAAGCFDRTGDFLQRSLQALLDTLCDGRSERLVVLATSLDLLSRRTRKLLCKAHLRFLGCIDLRGSEFTKEFGQIFNKCVFQNLRLTCGILRGSNETRQVLLSCPGVKSGVDGMGNFFGPPIQRREQQFFDECDQHRRADGGGRYQERLADQMHQ